MHFSVTESKFEVTVINKILNNYTFTCMDSLIQFTDLSTKSIKKAFVSLFLMVCLFVSRQTCEHKSMTLGMKGLYSGVDPGAKSRDF